MAHVVVRFDPLVERVEGECPTCRFDALVRIRLFRLSESGVSAVADVTKCARCAAERDRSA